MKIIGLSQNIVWKNPSANFKLIEEAFKDQEADLFLLPEMFTTGFCMDSEEIADDKEATLNWMKTFAKSKNAAIAGSVSVKENNRFYNRFYFVKPNGEYAKYDKRHLFSYSGEDKAYFPGKERVVVEYKGFRFLLQVCYDARFPVFARNQEDYDVLLNVANWPVARIKAWEILQRARAIENQAYVFAVNRTGIDGNGLEYPESSFCFFADGEEVSEKQGLLTIAELNLQKLQQYREKFPFLKDRDAFRFS